GRRGAAARAAWQQTLAQDPARQATFAAAIDAAPSADIGPAIDAFKRQIATEQPKLATRVASGQVLETLAPVLPELVGGSADLTPS
ncbi:transketolase, partial [Streptomyces scabiei]